MRGEGQITGGIIGSGRKRRQEENRDAVEARVGEGIRGKLGGKGRHYVRTWEERNDKKKVKSIGKGSKMLQPKTSVAGERERGGKPIQISFVGKKGEISFHNL